MSKSIALKKVRLALGCSLVCFCESYFRLEAGRSIGKNVCQRAPTWCPHLLIGKFLSRPRPVAAIVMPTVR